MIAPLLLAARLAVSPLLLQDVVLVRSDDVTAGGAGGGLGVLLVLDDRYLAQADVSLLWGLGTANHGRLALGVQLQGSWRPAAWVTGSVLSGERLDFFTRASGGAPHPLVAGGLRVSPLRFGGDAGVISLLEPGVSLGSGGLQVELTLLQASAGF